MAIKDKAASVLARLRNRAQELEISYQQILLLYCQEEFMRRLELSVHADKLILKGGLFLYLVTSYGSRTTMDADFLLHHHDNSEESVRALLEDVLNAPSDNDFVTFSIRRISPIALQQHYHGMQAAMTAHIKNIKVPFFLDLGVGDIIVPGAQRRSFSPLLADLTPPSVLTYSVESTIAEKYDAIVQRQSQTSRMKDFFDIYYLSRTFSFDGATLRQALHDTLRYRGTRHDAEAWNAVQSLATDANMQKKWDLYIRELNTESLPFASVMQHILHFLAPVAYSLIHERPFSAAWHPTEGWDFDS